MNIQELTAYINQNIRNNGVQAITGDLMQNVLNSIVATLSDGANIAPGSVTRGAIAPGAVDNTPTAGSNNLITSTAVAAAIKAIQTVVLENKELTDAELQNIINTGNELIDAVNDRIPISEKGMYNGVATLGEDGRVPASQLPGFVDDVKEGYLLGGVFYRDAEYTDPIEPQGDKIYIDLSTDKEYRWGGTKYAPISESLALGETTETAYAGSKGKQNAEDIERLKTGKQNTLVSGENIKTLNGESILGAGDIEISGGGAELIPITWTELVALRDAGQLVVGGLYRLKDYKPVQTSNVNMNVVNNPFDIVITAIAPNILSEECRAMLHDGDNYYSKYNCNLNAWRIWYCIDNDTTRFKWAQTTEYGGRGVIYRMIDDNMNDAPFDFKQIKWYCKSESKYIYTFSSSNDNDMSVIAKNIRNVKIESTVAPSSGEPKAIHFKVSSTNIKVSDSYILGDNNYVVVKSTTSGFEGNILYYVKDTMLLDGNSLGVKSLILLQCDNIKCYGSINASFFWLCSAITIKSNPNNNIIALATINSTIESSRFLIIMPGCENINIYSTKVAVIGCWCDKIDLQHCVGISIGGNCSDIAIGKFYGSYKNIICRGISVGNDCHKIYLNNAEDPSTDMDTYLRGLTVSNYVSNIQIEVIQSATKAYYEHITFLQGGRDANTLMVVPLNAYVSYSTNTSPARIACYNSAGEYKIFALADLVPA